MPLRTYTWTTKESLGWVGEPGTGGLSTTCTLSVHPVKVKDVSGH